MKIFHSDQYVVIGFEDGYGSRYRGWVLQQKVFSKDFVPEVVIIPEAKFIEGSKVIFLKSDGHAEYMKRQYVLDYERDQRVV